MQSSTNSNLLVFSKYPVAGKAKTRLIPALGAKVAAQLHRRMAENSIDMARKWKLNNSRNRHITIHYTGTNEKNFRSWLGPDLDYQEQPQGDLGQRMSSAVATEFSNGVNHVIGIGTDVPTLSPDLLRQADKNLKDHDLTIGPAIDGGYYLIGMKRFIPELFVDIDWGTDKVYQQTLQVATRLGLKIATLPTLSDIDLPDDLDSIKDDPRFSDVINGNPLLSIIIPTLNEANTLEKTIKSLQQGGDIEIIVADGGSDDGTDEIATRVGAKLIVTTDGRAAQLNLGAKKSTGRYLLFLHADTSIPDNYNKLIIEALDNPAIVAGAFGFKTDHHSTAMRVIEWGTNLRSKLLQTPYGDQGLFMEKRIFAELNGFPQLPIMEDFAFVGKLRKRGIITTLEQKAVTSARRWQQKGLLRTTLTNQFMIIGFLLGIPVKILSRIYRGK